MTSPRSKFIFSMAFLFVIAFLGYFLGGSKANPKEANPHAVMMELTDLDSIQLLPPEQRKIYLKPEQFIVEPVQNPLQTTSRGRRLGDPISDRKIEDLIEKNIRIVSVRQGENLSKIALRELGDSSRYVDLMRWNNIRDPKSIKIGQLLEVRLGSDTLGANFTNSDVIVLEEAVSVKPNSYVVQSGDVLSKISQKFYGTSKKINILMKANNLKNADSIRVGQKLIIPIVD